MIRSVGPAGPLKVFGLVFWQLRYDLLMLLVIAAIVIQVPDPMQDSSVAVVSVLGIAASIFIGFRNSNAYSRWWEARTLWGATINESRNLNNALTTLEPGSPGIAADLDRMRRRQARHAWQLTAELRCVPPLPGVVELTPEDPADSTATALMNRQAADVGQLAADGHVDEAARLVVMSALAALVSAQGGLERIRNQTIPVHYDMFIRGLAWLFGIVAFSRLDSSGQHIARIILGLALMGVFIVAERLGHFIEEPMNDRIFDLPMYRFCATITRDLLGTGHPLARPREPERAAVWM